MSVETNSASRPVSTASPAPTTARTSTISSAATTTCLRTPRTVSSLLARVTCRTSLVSTPRTDRVGSYLPYQQVFLTNLMMFGSCHLVDARSTEHASTLHPQSPFLLLLHNLLLRTAIRPWHNRASLHDCRERHPHRLTDVCHTEQVNTK
jgi:hypothetical protein